MGGLTGVCAVVDHLISYESQGHAVIGDCLNPKDAAMNPEQLFFSICIGDVCEEATKSANAETTGHLDCDKKIPES